MKKEESEQFAFWVCRRLYGRLAPYDRCWLCGTFHTPPSEEHPHNKRYDFGTADAAVEVVSVVDSEVLRNFSSWSKKHPGLRTGQPAEFGLNKPWSICIPGEIDTKDLDRVLAAVRSMEDFGITYTPWPGCRGTWCPQGAVGKLCTFCNIARTAPFDANRDDEGLMAAPGEVAIDVVSGLGQNSRSLVGKIEALLYPREDGRRTDVLQKMDLAEQQGKKRRVVCFVLDMHFSFLSGGVTFPESTRNIQFEWDRMHPVTDVVITSPYTQKTLMFRPGVWPGRTRTARDAKKTPSRRTLGCR
ncbi:hypothetical protein ACFXGR_28540 [Streptomyces mirabilis]|uniref:hypothetical protein n=1 Tax=Streptomyces mirabilis TaxID=68239 RepID=UPI003678F5B3